MRLPCPQRVVAERGRRRIQRGKRRQRVVALAGRGDEGQVGIGDGIDPPHGERIEAERARHRIHRALHHPGGDGHRRPHRPGGAFVGQPDLHVVAVVAQPVRPGQDHRNDPRHVVGGEEGPSAEIHVHRAGKPKHAAIGGDGGAGDDGLLARHHRGGEVLRAGLAPAHGLVQQARRGGQAEILAQRDDFLAEGAAHLGAFDRDLEFLEAQPRRDGATIGVRRLGPDAQGQVLAPRIPDRQHAARLERRVGLPVLREARLDHAVGAGEGGIEAGRREALAGDAVARHFGIHQGGGLLCLPNVRDGGQRAPMHLHALRRILSRNAIFRQHQRDGVADEAHGLGR